MSDQPGRYKVTGTVTNPPPVFRSEFRIADHDTGNVIASARVEGDLRTGESLRVTDATPSVTDDA